MLLSMEDPLQRVCDKFIYDTIQSFTGNKIAEYYASASKKKKAIASSIKFAKDVLTDTVSDLLKDGLDPLSPSQYFFATGILSMSSDERLKGMKGGLMKEKNYISTQVAEFGMLVLIQKNSSPQAGFLII